MIPIGRGQRQLIIGDRQTGKTAIAVDADPEPALQLGGPVTSTSRCAAYVAVGQKASPLRPCVRRSRTTAPWTTPRSWPPPPPVGRSRSTSPPTPLGHRPALDVRRQARPDRVRRPLQAGRGLPGRVPSLLRRPPGREAYPATSSTCTPVC
ncbi:hypothetical protein QJS66_00280 [Kocuria rhizophila]|nr:hypothetical protein QJS66_00280 [Kocuria rhizophila]